MKRTYQPSRIKRARTHGFRARSKKVLRSRRKKGRWYLVPTNKPRRRRAWYPVVR